MVESIEKILLVHDKSSLLEQTLRRGLTTHKTDVVNHKVEAMEFKMMYHSVSNSMSMWARGDDEVGSWPHEAL